MKVLINCIKSNYIIFTRYLQGTYRGIYKVYMENQAVYKVTYVLCPSIFLSSNAPGNKYFTNNC